jgi:hypothetical protein
MNYDPKGDEFKAAVDGNDSNINANSIDYGVISQNASPNAQSTTRNIGSKVDVSSKPHPIRFSGIRDPRGARTSRATLDDPRKPANRDLLALERRRLWLKATNAQPLAGFPYFMDRDDGEKEHKKQKRASALAANLSDVFKLPKAPTSGKPGPATPGTPVSAARIEEDSDGSLTLLVYRYTKQVEVINDELGYGERLVEEFYQPVDGNPKQLTRVLRVSQRTKTGRQQLVIDHSELQDELAGS